MAQTLDEADAIAAAGVENGVVVFVGHAAVCYCYDTVKEVMEGKDIKYVRVKDINGQVCSFSSLLLARIAAEMVVEQVLYESSGDVPTLSDRPTLLRKVRPRAAKAPEPRCLVLPSVFPALPLG